MRLACITFRHSVRRWTAVAVALLLLGTAGLAAAQPTTYEPRPAKKGTKYKVKVDSAPQGALVFLDDKKYGPVGNTPWQGSLSKGNTTVILELDGYQPATKVIKVARSRKLQETFVPLIKKQDPPRIDVRADADKNLFGANIFLDGQAQGAAPIVLTTITGRHLIEIKKEGFETFQTWVDSKENEKVTLTPVLKEIAKPKLGTVLVDADVPDGEVYIDGQKQQDTTPALITGLIEGLHVVEVRKEPAVPWKQTVQVIADKQIKVRAELKSTIGGQGGVVRVLSNVTGAHVFLDGTDMGEVPVDVKDVKAGEHVIEVKAAGYQSREERVVVNAGSSAVLKLDLNPATGANDGGGTLKVVSPVPEADVFIDGAVTGKVPQEKAVGAGEHFVVVKLVGYKTFEQKVRVEPGQTITVSAELKAVGRLRVLTQPAGAQVLINGVPMGNTPLDLDEVEVGENVVQLELLEYLPASQTITVEGGKTETINQILEPMMKGLTLEESEAEQRGLSSFGARTLPRGRSTVDIGIGYPYFADVRVNVGAGRLKNFGFDAGVGVRTMLSRSEIGIGARLMLVDADPFTLGTFGDLWWGSKLFDDSKRNGATLDTGVMASLTALTHVTITGRLYFEFWTDRHCPELDASNQFDGDAIEACEEYKAFVDRDMTSPTELTERMQELTGEEGADMFTRENGTRFKTSVVAEIAIEQRWNLWFMLEGTPFQSERALFTDPFSAPMLESDFGTYFRGGISYKF